MMREKAAWEWQCLTLYPSLARDAKTDLVVTLRSFALPSALCLASESPACTELAVYCCLEHLLKAHRPGLEGIDLDLRAIQGHLTRLRQSCLLC